MPERNAIIIVALAYLLSAGCVTSPDPDTSESVLAITHVNLIPMDRERVIPDQTVIVRHGRITSIGPADATKLPEDVSLVIEGQGKYLMPGLADMHVHFEEDHLALFVANGVTTVRNMFGAPEHLDWRERVNSGALLGPTIYTAGPIMDGDPPYWPGSGVSVVRTPEDAASEVLAQKKAGYDAIKPYWGLEPEVYAAILKAASEAEMPVYGHVPLRVGLEQALGGGQRSFEHMYDFMWALIPKDSPVRELMHEARLDESKRSVRSLFVEPLRSADPTRIPDLVAKAAASSAWFCPTLVVTNKQASGQEEYEQLRRRHEMRYVAPTTRAWWDMSQDRYTSNLAYPPTFRRAFETMRHAVKALHDGGARLLVGTDTPNPFVVPGFSVHEELQHLVDSGLTPYEALKAATHDAAEFVGALDEWGTVAVGRRADLILVDGNPLDDVVNAANRAGVVLRGRWLPEAELQAMLQVLADKYTSATE